MSVGGTLIDAADVYADGRSEQILGRWLPSRPDARDRAVIATKARGWLTGKYRRDEPPAEDTRLSDQMDQGMRIWNERGHLERNWQILDAVRKVAEGRGASMPQVAIAWVLAQPAVRSVILGAPTLGQLDDNLAAAGLELTDDETRLLDVATDPGAPDYPYGGRGQTQRDRRISGGRF